MIKTPNDEAIQAHLDKYYPFIAQDAEPPGRWVPNRRTGELRWVQQLGWRTQHGEAIVVWSSGKPSSVYFARYPDGSRGEVRHTLDYGFRRRAIGPKRWIYGTIEVCPDDVLFIDGEQPFYTPPPVADVANLEAELARDEAFLAAIKEDRFARAVYKIFMNRTFLKGSDAQRWCCGDRQAAHLVAHLRRMGESYHDFYLDYGLAGVWPDDRAEREAWLHREIELASRPIDALAKLAPPTAPAQAQGAETEESRKQAEDAWERWRQEFERRRPELEELQRKRLESYRQQLAEMEANENGDVLAALHGHLARLGWRTENEDDRVRARRQLLQRRVAILQELKELARRPEAPAGEWTEHIRKRRRGGLAGPIRLIRSDSLDSLSENEREVETGRVNRRLDDLALTGRLSQQEHEALVMRLNEK